MDDLDPAVTTRHHPNPQVNHHTPPNALTSPASGRGVRPNGGRRPASPAMTRADTDTHKRIGWWLLTLAGLLTIATVLIWQKADQDAEHERITAAYEAAITGVETADPEPNRTPALITLGAAGITAICATTLLLTRPTTTPPASNPGPQTTGAT